MLKTWTPPTIHVRVPPDMMESIESIVEEEGWESISQWVRAVLKREIRALRETETRGEEMKYTRQEKERTKCEGSGLTVADKSDLVLCPVCLRLVYSSYGLILTHVRKEDE